MGVVKCGSTVPMVVKTASSGDGRSSAPAGVRIWTLGGAICERVR
eukprot:COSAG04_NODE_22267_length_358_cov_0.482625_1_plen_45_part_00